MARQLRLSLGQDSPPVFDDFACGPSNADAFAAVRTWPSWPGGCLALVGPAGAGKSHLAQAWAAEAGALILDRGAADVEAAAGRPVLVEDADQGISDEALFHLVNLAAREGGSLLLTARTLPGAWPAALPDLRSRLNALPVAQIAPPDDEVLEGALRRFFLRRNIRPAEEVYPYLLARMGRSIPDAEEIVRRLDEAGDEGFKPVTRVLARQILESDLDLE
ncbi:MAG: chromosomal replication initiator DnaA [Phenylobacterium zucineum]|nr:MAG: chromosomal replication initiator DnaA [Phenylobacterium zucineum]